MDFPLFTTIADFISEHRTTIAVVGIAVALAQLFSGVIDRVFEWRRMHTREQVVLVEDAQGDRAAVVVDPTDPESIRRMLQKVKAFEGVTGGGPDPGASRPA